MHEATPLTNASSPVDPADTISSADAWFEFEDGRREYFKGSCTLGRSTQNRVIIDDGPVSRFHALVQPQDAGEHLLVDLGSSNGTFVNDRRIGLPTRLKNGDRIRIGRPELVFRKAATAGEPPQDRARRTQSTEVMASVERGPRWLLVADIVSYSKLSQEMAMEELAQRVGVWIHDCKLVLTEHQAQLNKYLGDGFLGYWPGESVDPRLVFAAACQLRRIQAQRGPRFRVVVHFGETFIDRRIASGEDNLVGPEVNFVFRMEKVAASLAADWLLSAPAAWQLRQHIELLSAGAHAVPGFDGHHEFHSPMWGTG